MSTNEDKDGDFSKPAVGFGEYTWEETTDRVDEPTPNGGTYSIAYYRDDKIHRVPRALATRVEIVEFDKDDVPFFRTHGTFKGPLLPFKKK